MSSLKEMMERRRELAAELHKMDESIRSISNLPYGWSLVSGGPMSGAVTIVSDDDEDPVLVCVSSGAQYGDVLIIQQHEREQEIRCNWKGVDAVIQLHKLLEQQKRLEREAKCKGRSIDLTAASVKEPAEMGGLTYHEVRGWAMTVGRFADASLDGCDAHQILGMVADLIPLNPAGLDDLIRRWREDLRILKKQLLSAGDRRDSETLDRLEPQVAQLERRIQQLVEVVGETD